MDGCFSELDECMKVVKKYSNKHIHYEDKFKECSKRSKKNSDRNTYLR